VTNASGDVVIVGGGIAGIATAYYLAEAGFTSTIIERDGLASHSSGFAYGGLSGGIPNGPDANYPLIAEGMRLHRELAKSLADETDIDIQFRDSPAMRIALTENEVTAGRQHLAWQQAQPGFDVRWLSGDEARALEPRLNPETMGALYVEGSADVEPYRLTLALAQSAERRGATIRTGEVTGLSRDGDRVRGVVVDGELLAAERVVLAMGPWSGDASDWLGIPLPVRPLKGQIIRLKATGEPISISVGHGKNYAMTKPSDGLIWAGTTEEEAGFDESKTTDARDDIIDSILRMLPSLEEAVVVLQTACLRPVARDNRVVLGTVPTLEGVFLSTGAGRQGIMMGPAMGKVIADLIVHGKTNISIDDYCPERFIQ
jgi:glycine oxidase